MLEYLVTVLLRKHSTIWLNYTLISVGVLYLSSLVPATICPYCIAQMIVPPLSSITVKQTIHCFSLIK